MSDVHLKLLIPCAAVGAIIGRGGEAVEAIKQLTGARLKMSKANDFYPGTTERICLITGTAKGCLQLNDYIMQKVCERSKLLSSHSKAHFLQTPVGRHRQVKILVPNTTIGLIIGKSGAFIKKIKDISRATIQISQRPRELKLMERCIVITGEFEERRIAVSMVISKILEDPDSSDCCNYSYIKSKEPLASAFPTGSPFAHGTEELPTGKNSNTRISAAYAESTFNAYAVTRIRSTQATFPQSLSTLLTISSSDPSPVSTTNPCYISDGHFATQSNFSTSTNVLHNPLLAFNIPSVYTASLPYATPSDESTTSVAWVSDAPVHFPLATVPETDADFSSPVFPNGPILPSDYHSEFNKHLTSALQRVQLNPFLQAADFHSTSANYLVPSQAPALTNYDDCVDPTESISSCTSNLPTMYPLPHHCRYWSGNSTDSALTESFTSVCLHSSADDHSLEAANSPQNVLPSYLVDSSNSSVSVDFCNIHHSDQQQQLCMNASQPFPVSFSNAPTPFLIAPDTVNSADSNPMNMNLPDHLQVPVMHPFTNFPGHAASIPSFTAPRLLCWTHLFNAPPTKPSCIPDNCDAWARLPFSSNDGFTVHGLANYPAEYTPGDGLMVVGTALHIRSMLCALHPILRTNGICSKQLQVACCSITSASFPPDTPLRLDSIQPLNPPGLFLNTANLSSCFVPSTS